MCLLYIIRAGTLVRNYQTICESDTISVIDYSSIIVRIRSSSSSNTNTYYYTLLYHSRLNELTLCVCVCVVLLLCPPLSGGAREGGEVSERYYSTTAAAAAVQDTRHKTPAYTKHCSKEPRRQVVPVGQIRGRP